MNTDIAHMDLFNKPLDEWINECCKDGDVFRVCRFENIIIIKNTRTNTSYILRV